MAIKVCKYCGKEFEGTGKSSYCPGPHFSVCKVCGKQFEVDPRAVSQCCSKACKTQLRKQTISQSTKVCKLCGESFHPTSNTSEYCDREHYLPCPICRKPVKVTHIIDTPPCCSVECTTELRRRTCLDKYGVDVASKSDEVRNKLKLAATSQHSIDKRRSTCLVNWGVDNPSKHSAVRAKISNTVAGPICQSKMRDTTKTLYGVPFAMQSEEGLQRYVETIQAKYGVPYFCMTDECKAAQGNIVSSVNRLFGNLLKQHNISYEFEFRLEDKSYDIHILGTNILIELNPTYTHNAVGNHWGKGKDCEYHLIKTQLAAKHGYRCIHVFDWDSVDKVVALLSDKHKIYARNCTVSLIDATTASKFEDIHHLQGRCRQQDVCIGLYHDDVLVQVMTFGPPRYNKQYEWELLRLCSDSRYKIVGGANRLFHHFLSEFSPRSIISYCDVSKFSGDIYTKLGFTLHHHTEPNKVWSKGTAKVTNNLLLSRGFDQLFNTNYGKGTSNEQLMLEHNWLPVYDCGQSVYEWERDNYETSNIRCWMA